MIGKELEPVDKTALFVAGRRMGFAPSTYGLILIDIHKARPDLVEFIALTSFKSSKGALIYAHLTDAGLELGRQSGKDMDKKKPK